MLAQFIPWRRTRNARDAVVSVSCDTTISCDVPIRPEPADHRLRRLGLWLRTGQAAAAELELHEWARHDECPAEARVLLASLRARRGDREAALETLAGIELDMTAAQLRIALLTALGRVDEARIQAQRLHHEHGEQPEVAHWLGAMEAPGYEQLPAVPDAAVDHLAGELVGRFHLIRSLVAAQKARAELKSVRLLRDAIQRLAPEVNDDRQMLIVCEAMAELSLLIGDTDDARRWAHRGLRHEPYYAPLALVVAQIDDDPAIGPSATRVLETTVQSHPTYRDVLAALIRRRHAEGQTQVAMHHLQQWLADEPGHPMAQALRIELAA